MSPPRQVRKRPDLDCVIRLRNTRTGEERDYVDEGIEVSMDGGVTWEAYPGGDDYLWMDGNYACDCNRALFFARAGGEPEPEGPHYCIGQYRFVVVSPERLADESEG